MGMFCFDSTEVNRIWPQKNFTELPDRLIDKNLQNNFRNKSRKS